MSIDQLETAILAERLTPIHLYMGKGRHVKWFVCLDTRPKKEYALIVYDSKGKALVLPDYHEPIDVETSFVIQEYDGGIKINGYFPQRDHRLDLKVREDNQA